MLRRINRFSRTLGFYRLRRLSWYSRRCYRLGRLNRLFWLRIDDAIGLPQECYNLSTGTRLIRTKLVRPNTSSYTMIDSPCNRMIVIVVAMDIREQSICTFHGRILCTPDKGHDLTTGACLVGTELVAADTGGDPILHRPRHGLGKIVICIDIGKAGAAGDIRRLRGAVRSPQEGHGLGTGASLMGAELPVPHACRHIVGDCPVHRILEICVAGDIRECRGSHGLDHQAAAHERNQHP